MNYGFIGNQTEIKEPVKKVEPEVSATVKRKEAPQEPSKLFMIIFIS